MATNRTDSLIKASGGDYSTIQAWEDDIGVGLGTSTNLVTDDYEHHGWMAAAEFSENVTIGGHTTDSTHYIKIQADSSSRSGGGGTPTDSALMDADRALTYNTSYASHIQSSTYANALISDDQYTKLERLQYSAGSNGRRGVKFNAANCSVHRCLFAHTGGTTSPGYNWRAGSGITFTVTSSLFYNNSTVDCVPWGAPAGETIGDASSKLYNCTIVNASTGREMGVGYARPQILNCAIFGSSDDPKIDSRGPTTWGTLDYNACDATDLSSLSGEGSNNQYSLTFSDQFTAVDTTDWRVKTGNGLAGNGTNSVSGTVSVDIFGNSFDSSDWTIGCQHYASGGATSITPTTGSLSLTGATPSVAIKLNVSPTAGSLSITGATPTVTPITNVSPTAGSLSLAGSTPSVALKLNVAPTAGSLSVTGETPSVATKTNVNVTGGTVSLTGATPGVEVVTPGVTAITVTAGSISLAGATPAVAIKLNVSPTAADLSITGATPSVNISKNISPTAGSISLAGATPAVALKLNVAPTAGTLALSGSTVTVVNTGDVAVTPARRDGGGGGRKRQQRRREFSEEELERLDVETKSVIETLYGPPTPEPAQEAPAVPDVSKERLERLVALRDAVRQDEQKIRALGARLEDLESEITFIEARREEDSLLLLLLAVE